MDADASTRGWVLGWLDPRCCTAAREYLRHGSPVQAAQVLLESPDGDHRSVRLLQLRVSRELVEMAARDFRAGRISAAHDAIELAGRCGALTGEARSLRDEIAKAQVNLKLRNDFAHQQVRRR